MSEPAPSTTRVLRKLYLTLFLRGRTSRGLQRSTAPKSVVSKLAVTLLLYTLFGLLALRFQTQGVFMFSFYMHGMTMLFLGMFIATSSGEVLFNKEEGEILLHRPVTPRALLWSKISVLLQVSLWLALACNLISFIAGAIGENGSWMYPVAHLVSTAMAALLCAGGVVLMYQLCLRWFGRDKLENLMTTTQVLMTLGVVAVSQSMPYVMATLGTTGLGSREWWLYLCPPAWFAGFDEVLTGHGSMSSWILAAVAVALTVTIPGLAFWRLADGYQAGLQTLTESVPRRPRKEGKRRWLDGWIDSPPLSWVLRDPMTRAGFRLTAAYMFRDREMKLRLYPGLAPILVMPLVFLLQNMRDGGGLGVVFGGSYLALLPLMALNLLQFSQQWQASDVFRAAPMAGPAPLIEGARLAVLTLLVMPALTVLLLGVLFLIPGGESKLALLLPGLIALPVCSLIPGTVGKGIPLASPSDEAKSASRGLLVMGTMIAALALGGVALVARSGGWYAPFLGMEAAAALLLYLVLKRIVRSTTWPPAE